MIDKVVAKFTLTKVAEVNWNKDTRVYTFNAVCDSSTPENERFCKYTPNGTFEMSCNNPSVIEYFELGKSYYFEMKKAE